MLVYFKGLMLAYFAHGTIRLECLYKACPFQCAKLAIFRRVRKFCRQKVLRCATVGVVSLFSSSLQFSLMAVEMLKLYICMQFSLQNTWFIL